MKALNILVFMILISLLGCDKIVNGGVYVPECEKHSDCENDLICVVNQCEVDLCKIENYCGEGVCVYESGSSNPDDMIYKMYCECKPGMRGRVLYCAKDAPCRKDPRFCETYPELCNDAEYENKSESEWRATGCYYTEPCYDSLFCMTILSNGFCDRDNTCSGHCYSDDNCFAKDEFCDKTNYACYPVSVFTCEDGEYFSAVEQKCVAKCSQNSDCSEPVAHCNEVSGVCVSKCTTNEDCTGFKWSGGSVCNSNGFCE